MSIVNGGYAKVTKYMYEIGYVCVSDPGVTVGAAYCDYAYCTTRREAVARTAKPGWRVTRVVADDSMSEQQLDQAREALFGIAPPITHSPVDWSRLDLY